MAYNQRTAVVRLSAGPLQVVLVALMLTMANCADAQTGGSIDYRHEYYRLSFTSYIDKHLWTLVILPTDVLNGDTEAAAQLKSSHESLSRVLSQLESRASSAEVRDKDGFKASLASMQGLLKEEQIQIGILDRSQAAIVSSLDARDRVAAEAPELLKSLDVLVREMASARADATQIYVASRNSILVDRMVRRAGEMAEGGDRGLVSAEATLRDLKVVREVLAGFRDGNATFGIARLQTPNARSALEKAIGLFEGYAKTLEVLTGNSRAVYEASMASSELSRLFGALADERQKLEMAFGRPAD